MESKENTEERPRNNTPYNCHTCQNFSCTVTDNTPRMMQPALMDREGSVRANVCYRNKDNHDKTDEEGNGNQNFYMNDTFVGQTLRLIGFINEEVYDEIYVTIYDGR